MRWIQREECHDESDESMVTGQRGSPRFAASPTGGLPLGKIVSRRSADVRLAASEQMHSGKNARSTPRLSPVPRRQSPGGVRAPGH